MDIHKNARLTPKGREAMVRAVVDGGLTKAATAREYHTTPKKGWQMGRPLPRGRGGWFARPLLKTPFVAKPNRPRHSR